MSKFLVADGFNAGEPTFSALLVFNRSLVPQPASNDSHVLGGKEFAWIQQDDETMLRQVETGIFKVIKSGTVNASELPSDKSTLTPRKSKK